MAKEPKCPAGFYWVRFNVPESFWAQPGKAPQVAHWDNHLWYITGLEIGFDKKYVTVLSRRLSEPLHEKKIKDEQQTDTAATN